MSTHFVACRMFQYVLFSLSFFYIPEFFTLISLLNQHSSNTLTWSFSSFISIYHIFASYSFYSSFFLLSSPRFLSFILPGHKAWFRILILISGFVALGLDIVVCNISLFCYSFSKYLIGTGKLYAFSFRVWMLIHLSYTYSIYFNLPFSLLWIYLLYTWSFIAWDEYDSPMTNVFCPIFHWFTVLFCLWNCINWDFVSLVYC